MKNKRQDYRIREVKIEQVEKEAEQHETKGGKRSPPSPTPPLTLDYGSDVPEHEIH